MHLVPSPSFEGEAEVDRVLMKIMLENTSLHKNSMIYIRKQEWVYQNKVNFSLVSHL